MPTGESGGADDAEVPTASADPGTIVSSVLTFILLVVLGGGAGLWVVSMAESPKPATDGSQPPRAQVRELLRRLFPERDGTRDDAEPEDEADFEETPVYRAEPVTAAVGADPGAGGPAPAEGRRPPRRNGQAGGPVPKAYTAIEGRFADVAHVPLWRRALSLIGIVVIALIMGVGIAAVLGAAFAAVAEVFSNTIG